MEYVKVASISDIPSGKMKMVRISDKPILIANVDGKYYAMANKCTHRGADLSKGTLQGKTVTCPSHKSTFDITTGKSITGPKSSPDKKNKDEPIYKIKIEGKDILISLT